MEVCRQSSIMDHAISLGPGMFPRFVVLANLVAIRPVYSSNSWFQLQQQPHCHDHVDNIAESTSATANIVQGHNTAFQISTRLQRLRTGGLAQQRCPSPSATTKAIRRRYGPCARDTFQHTRLQRQHHAVPTQLWIHRFTVLQLRL